MERIDRLTSPPIVGRLYLVPVLRATWCWMMGDWPVHGTMHEDANFIGFEPEHWHVDSRFLPERIYQRSLTYNGYHRPAAHIGAPIHADPRYGLNTPLPQPVIKRRQMRREYDAWPREDATWMPRLEAAHDSCRLKPGKVCPHRGGQLATVHPDENGVVTCPLHGLRWNVGTGELVTAERERVALSGLRAE